MMWPKKGADHARVTLGTCGSRVPLAPMPLSWVTCGLRRQGEGRPRPDSYPRRSISMVLRALDLPARWLAPISLALSALVDLGLGAWLTSQDHSPPRRPSRWPEGVPRSR